MAVPQRDKHSILDLAEKKHTDSVDIFKPIQPVDFARVYTASKQHSAATQYRCLAVMSLSLLACSRQEHVICGYQHSPQCKTLLLLSFSLCLCSLTSTLSLHQQHRVQHAKHKRCEQQLSQASLPCSLCPCVSTVSFAAIAVCSGYLRTVLLFACIA